MNKDPEGYGKGIEPSNCMIICVFGRKQLNCLDQLRWKKYKNSMFDFLLTVPMSVIAYGRK